MLIYCLRCHKKVPPQKIEKLPLARAKGMVRVSARCPSCGGKLSGFVKKGQ